MLVPIPDNKEWSDHVALRFSEASEIALVDSGSALVPHSSKVFLPSGLKSMGLADVAPTTPLRTLTENCDLEEGTWIERPDLFGDAAEWLCEKYGGDPEAWLFCEAGYSRLGDKGLAEVAHIAREGRPFLLTRLAEATPHDVATLLRWARSWRMIGLISSGWDASHHQLGSSGLFVCDTLDCDSLIVTPFGAGERLDVETE